MELSCTLMQALAVGRHLHMGAEERVLERSNFTPRLHESLLVRAGGLQLRARRVI